MTGYEKEVWCSQSIIFRKESRWIKVASCHFRDVRQIPADCVNIAVRVCVLSPFCPPYQSICQPLSPCAVFLTYLLLLSFLFVKMKSKINQKADETCEFFENTLVSIISRYLYIVPHGHI